MTLQGKNYVQTTIITGYRPCNNSSGNDNFYLQQQCCLSAKQIDTCPHELWFKELSQLVKNKLDNGHQIIVMADMNNSVKQRTITAWVDKT